MKKQDTSILIANTDKLICETFAGLLQINGYQTWTCQTEPEIAPLLQLHQPTVAFIGHDISPDDNLALAANLKTQYPIVQFVIFTHSPSLDHATQAMGAGMDGYLLYEDGFADLLDCLEWLQHGSPYLSPIIRRRLLAQATEMEETDPLISKREGEILALIAQKRTNKEIAELLFVSLHTVQQHRKNIKSKLSLKGGKNILTQYLKSTLHKSI